MPPFFFLSLCLPSSSLWSLFPFLSGLFSVNLSSLSRSSLSSSLLPALFYPLLFYSSSLTRFRPCTHLTRPLPPTLLFSLILCHLALSRFLLFSGDCRTVVALSSPRSCVDYACHMPLPRLPYLFASCVVPLHSQEFPSMRIKLFLRPMSLLLIVMFPLDIGTLDRSHAMQTWFARNSPRLGLFCAVVA